MKVKFKSRKLKSSIVKVNERVKNNILAYKDYIVYGVTKDGGISLTGNITSEDLSEYIVVGEKTFAFNPYRVNIGSIGLSGNDFKGLVSPAYVVFKTNEDLLSDFLFHYLKSDVGIKLINWYGNRGGVRNALRFDDLGEIDIPDLSIQQQKEALIKFHAAQSNLESLNKELDLQKTYIQFLRQTILQEAVQGKLTKQAPTNEPAAALLKRIKAEKEKLIQAGKIKKEKELPPIAEEDIPFELPEGWVWCRLGDIGKFSGGGTPSKMNAEYWLGDIPWVTPKDMKSETIRSSIDHISEAALNNSSAKLINAGSVLVVVRGMVLIKNIPIAINAIPVTINQDMKAITLFVEGLNKYIQLFLLSWQVELRALVERSTHGTGKLDTEILTHLIIPLPSLVDQRRIVEKVQQLQQQVSQLELYSEQSWQYSGQLLQCVLREAFGIAGDIDFEVKAEDIKLEESREALAEEVINFTSMNIIEILHQAKKPVQASKVWKQSEYQNDIEEFYAMLKKLVDEDKSVVEEKIGKDTYLKLSEVEN